MCSHPGGAAWARAEGAQAPGRGSGKTVEGVREGQVRFTVSKAISSTVISIEGWIPVCVRLAKSPFGIRVVHWVCVRDGGGTAWRLHGRRAAALRASLLGCDATCSPDHAPRAGCSKAALRCAAWQAAAVGAQALGPASRMRCASSALTWPPPSSNFLLQGRTRRGGRRRGAQTAVSREGRQAQQAQQLCIMRHAALCSSLPQQPPLAPSRPRAAHKLAVNRSAKWDRLLE